MDCSNAGLLALWLILCTQGHEDFNLSSWQWRSVCLLLCVCIVCIFMRSMCTCMHLFVFSLIFPLYFHQITNSNDLPLAIIAHFSADLTRWEVRVCYTLCLCMHQNGEGKLSKCAKTNTRCSLWPKWSIICTNLLLYAIIAPLALLLQKMTCWMLKQEYKTLYLYH